MQAYFASPPLAGIGFGLSFFAQPALPSNPFTGNPFAGNQFTGKPILWGTVATIWRIPAEIRPSFYHRCRNTDALAADGQIAKPISNSGTSPAFPDTQSNDCLDLRLPHGNSLVLGIF